MSIPLVTQRGNTAIWTYIKGEPTQFVAIAGQEEVTIQEGSLVLKTLRWPGGVPDDTTQFEYAIKKYLEGDDFLQVIYERR
ncbi:hypothetical protein ABGV42_00840 [Paenibacillus pabuli]|uniref:hypothetical protein n=1 Tax=Paenibacillus pabuli TaxID=1472 RepID=UPI003242514E